MRTLFASLLAVALAVPAQAQDDPPPPAWVGVWQGTIGKMPVTACLDESYDGQGRGSYYYMKYLVPIDLDSDTPPGNWTEGEFNATGVGDPQPVWKLQALTKDSIEGQWSGSKRSLPIKLTRAEVDSDDASMPCASAAFLNPRVATVGFLAKPAELDGFAYSTLTYATPPQFSDVSISGFRFVPSQEGDEAINDWLAAQLPQGSVEDEYIQCMAGSLQIHGVDGYYEMSIVPAFANSELLAVTRTQGDYCGGAHPNYVTQYATFDRHTGEFLNPSSWFSPAGITDDDEYGLSGMQPALRDLIVAHWPSYDDEADDCSGAADEQDWWNYQIARDGIVFQPDFPHAMTACEEEVLVPWEELVPFLSETGKQLRERAGR